jgi:hypothetical protein
MPIQAMSKTQLEIDFEPGLVERFPEFIDCVKASVYGSRKQFKAIAADLDMSSSDLSRRFADNPNDPIHFPAKLLGKLIGSTGDLTPIYWLIEKFCEDSDAKQRRALEALVQLSRDLPALLRNAGAKP